MRFISTILITITIGIFLVQSIDIRSYQNYHSTSNKYQDIGAIKEQTFLDNSDVIESPQKEDWLIVRID
jgi:hypothetical protein